jgi:hypothetical protein
VKYSLALLALFAAASFQLQAQAPAATPQASAPIKDPVTASLKMLLPRSRNNTLGAIAAMPADKFSYKPTPEQVTFAHMVVHIAGSNNLLCSSVADLPAPKVEELKETDSRDKMLAAATASFDFCGDALNKMTDAKLNDEVELFGRKFPRAMAALGLASGWADHYAALAQYLRLNGITPPSAQPKK